MLTWSVPTTVNVQGIQGGLVVQPWLVLLEDKLDATHIKIEASGKIEFAASVLPETSLDGYLQSSVPDTQKLLAGCPFGALIGKFGGSSASCRPPETPQTTASPGFDIPFSIGSFCVVEVPTNIEGALFIGFNALLRPVRVTDFKIKVSKAM